ncbi:MAG: alpha/beta hydrolase [Actinobacteria bacterium]|nr:alpha/beta hydrolase [Actinomycetota bacterium]
MPDVVSDGARLFVEVIGEGDPVTVLAHGLSGSRGDISIFAPYLPGTKVLFDFRGHGESERPPPGHYSMDHFAGDVDAVARAFGATGVAGISLGGGATLRLLSRDPARFERVAVLLPARLERSSGERARFLKLADLLEERPLEEVAEALVAEETALGSFDAFPAAAEIRRQAILRMNPDGIPHAIRECIDDPPVRDPEPITRVPAPVLVIGQEGDPVHAAEVARELAATLPRGELVMFPDPFALIRNIPDLVQRTAAFLAAERA